MRTFLLITFIAAALSFNMQDQCKVLVESELATIIDFQLGDYVLHSHTSFLSLPLLLDSLMLRIP